MIVVGGCYGEQCAHPPVDELYGSGGRAAMAIAATGQKVEWHYYAPTDKQADTALILSNPNLVHCAHNSEEAISFRYFQPLSRPVFSPRDPLPNTPFTVSGTTILRFGFMEGEAIVHGDKVVFDPQSPHRPTPFSENGSTAKELAIVLNTKEVLVLGEAQEEHEAVTNILLKEKSAQVVLVKAGAEGCRVYDDGALIACIPPYQTEKVYKIGSGDIFSATFAYQWGVKGLRPEEAADIASRCTARYCETRSLSADIDDRAGQYIAALKHNKDAKIYVAGPFFTMAELWLVEEACTALFDLGVPFFSPYHHVGIGPPEKVVQPDIEGLKDCTTVFAIIDGCDPGTMFEVGYAVSNNIPVVALSQNPKTGDLTMLQGSDRCSIVDDFSTAIYRAAWESWS